jgi:ketosteroid isomerase-like protein
VPVANPRDIADRFFAAWTSRDFPTARALLHDDLDFKGPIDTFNNADDYLKAIQGLASILKTVEKRKTFVDGDDVCEIYDLVTNTPAGTAPVAEWYRVKGDKIAMIRVYFDARPFGPPPQH